MTPRPWAGITTLPDVLCWYSSLLSTDTSRGQNSLPSSSFSARASHTRTDEWKQQSIQSISGSSGDLLISYDVPYDIFAPCSGISNVICQRWLISKQEREHSKMEVNYHYF